MPTLADLFLACKGFDLFGFAILIFEFGWFQGLTCDFAGIFRIPRAAGLRNVSNVAQPCFLIRAKRHRAFPSTIFTG